MFNIAVLISGTGTNLKSLIEAIKRSDIENAKIALVVSDRNGAGGINIAKQNNIPCKIISKNQPDVLLTSLLNSKIDFIVLAGYLSILPPEIIDMYPKKIINIHPSLIPSFCGDGFYGIKVHRAVLERGCKITGVTVHYVDSGVDTGEIIAQEPVKVLLDDTPQILSKRVLETEHKILVDTIKNITKIK